MSDEHVTRRWRVPTWVSLAMVVLGAIAVRASVLFGTSLMPGMNGAYYLVQVRAVIEKGHLGEHDMPLVFWLQAGLALLVKAVGRLDLEPAIVLASKLFDSVVPALAAVPAFLLAIRWPGSRHSAWAGIAAATLAVLSSGPLRMVGDFQKNAFGMVLVLWSAFCLQQSLARKSWRYLTLAAVFLGLVGITHIGAFGVTLILVVLTGIAWALFVDRKPVRALMVIGGGAVAIVGLLGLLTLLGDSSRIAKLVSYLKMPLSLFSFRNVTGIMRGGPGFSGASSWQSVLFFGGLAAFAVAVLIWRRRDVQPWERALVVSAALLTLFLSSPFLSQDMSSRFVLMAFAPAVILVGFLFARGGTVITRSAVTVVTLAVVLLAVPPVVRSVSSPSIAQASYAELQSLQAQVSDASTTLVIAQHGLEWWAAWALHTDVAQPMAVTDADWTAYTSVLYLQETGNGRGVGTGLAGMPGRDGRPPAGAGFTRPTPPAGTVPVQPGLPSGTAPSGRGGFGGITLPSDASTLHSGTYFTLSRLPTAVIMPGGFAGRP
ncbi:MAG TPA: hypothetical protein VII15_02475 [Candidatus Cryosericum sp.]